MCSKGELINGCGSNKTNVTGCKKKFIVVDMGRGETITYVDYYLLLFSLQWKCNKIELISLSRFNLFDESLL